MCLEKNYPSIYLHPFETEDGKSNLSIDYQKGLLETVKIVRTHPKE